MNLTDLPLRAVPAPWAEGDNIPWNEPGFSRRMLSFHLSQDHDAASRRAEMIDRHVDFIHKGVLGSRPARILDLGCGPGLYLQRLARLGHTCRGIDFSPASIEYARRCAVEEKLSIDFTLSDLRQANFGSGHDLVMLIFGEFNVFPAAQAREILRKAQAALRPGGCLLLEPSPEGFIRGLGRQSAVWSAQEGGLFSDRPHLLLEESFWDEERKAATNRYFVIDAATADVTRCAASYQAYSEVELTALIQESGFKEIVYYPNLANSGPRAADFIAVTAKKDGSGDIFVSPFVENFSDCASG